jgi:hypothetical protein
MKFVNIGFGNMVAATRVIAVVSPESSPIKRAIRESEDKGLLINATYGRRTRAVIFMDSEHVVLSAIMPETISKRLEGEEAEDKYESGE